MDLTMDDNLPSGLAMPVRSRMKATQPLRRLYGSLSYSRHAVGVSVSQSFSTRISVRVASYLVAASARVAAP